MTTIKDSTKTGQNIVKDTDMSDSNTIRDTYGPTSTAKYKVDRFYEAARDLRISPVDQAEVEQWDRTAWFMEGLLLLRRICLLCI